MRIYQKPEVVQMYLLCRFKHLQLFEKKASNGNCFQALSMLLNATPYAFVIDLACLASRREYLKLDKWLNDKISEHKVRILLSCYSISAGNALCQQIRISFFCDLCWTDP